MRILVTGSRDWANWSFIWEQLNKAASEPGIILIHGDCPTGADFFADQWASTQPDVTVERYPAEWKKYGKRAGFIRNKQMVDLGADICLAFIRENSKGASMTARLAEEAGIPVERFIE